MDNATLVKPDIEAGRKLLEGLDDAKFEFQAAFWFYREESEEWRLYIATPLVAQLGPREAYSRVLGVPQKKQIHSIDLSRVSVVDVTDGLVTVLGYAVKTDPGSSDIDFNGNSVHLPPPHLRPRLLRPHHLILMHPRLRGDALGGNDLLF
jgi:hypothetical protein